MTRPWLHSLRRFLGIEPENVSSAEKLVATFGGVLSLFIISLITYKTTGAQGTAIIAPSMGAATVLLFAVPHGRLSQPWALLGGNVVSAAIGVTCYKLVPDPMLAARLAVGLTIGAMHVLSCIHPPGGATALAAVIGGADVHALGYYYVVAPVLLNVVTIFIVAVVFNSFFPWRRYPASLMRFTAATDAANPARTVGKAFIEQAMADMNTIVDFTTEDLQRLITLALQHAESVKLTPQQIVLGHYYTNGKLGSEWSVRQIIDESTSTNPRHDMVIYRVVEGTSRNSADSCTRSEFAQWAAREVVVNRA